VENSIGALQSFTIGDEEIKNTKLRIADVALSGSEMLVGADFFLSHRVMVARSQRKLYFTYNGGPVFRLDKPADVIEDAPSAAPTPAASAVQTTAGDGGALNADELTRRAAAEAARNDSGSALADLNRAIALDPKASAAYYQRAKIRSRSNRKAALADLDEAIKLKPGDQDILLTRGRLRLEAKDPKGAQADFNAAMKLTPNDKTLPLNVAGDYAEAHYLEPALELFDAWIASHPADALMGPALNERCWARALAGVDLQKALADCDAAISRGDRRPSVRDSRGLVLLRLGRLDDAIAEYNLGLRLDPKQAWSLYGRGVAKSKKGQVADGKADIAAALAIQSNIHERAISFGIVPDDAPAAAKPSAP